MKYSYTKIVYSIIIGIFCTLLILPWFEKREKAVNVEIAYHPGAEINEELVWIENIYVNGHYAAPDNYTEEIEFKENDNSYRWDGFREVTLNMEMKAWDTLNFEMGYRPMEEESHPHDGVIEIRIGDRNYEMPLNTFFNEKKSFVYRELRWQYWGYCCFLFLLFTSLWYYVLTVSGRNGEAKSNTLKWYIREISTSRIFHLLLWAATTRIYMNRWTTDYFINNDTSSYLIDSLGDLSWFCRMPVYQIMLLTSKKILHPETEENFFQQVMWMQTLLGVLACILFYLALKKILKKEKLAFAGAMIYAAQPYIIYWERSIMTESIAVDMMIGLVWLLALYLEKPCKGMAFGMGIYSLLLTLTRPSFVILFPILAVFFLLKLFTDKDERIYTFFGIAGMALSACLLLLYCRHNQHLTGQFMLSNISYHNEISIVIDNGIYENDRYPEIVQKINARMEAGETSALGIAAAIFGEQSQYAAKYIRDTISKNPMEYINAVLGGWEEYRHKPIWCDPGIPEGKYFEEKYEDISTLLMPFSFWFIALFCMIELLNGIVLWCRTKRVPWIEMGLCVLILSVMVLGFATLTFARPTRICVCIIPLSVALIFKFLENAMDKIYSESYFSE